MSDITVYGYVNDEGQEVVVKAASEVIDTGGTGAPGEQSATVESPGTIEGHVAAIVTAEGKSKSSGKRSGRKDAQEWPAGKGSTALPPLMTTRLPKKLAKGSYIYFDGHKYVFEGYETDQDLGTILQVRDIGTRQKVQLESIHLALAVQDHDAPIYAATLAELNVEIDRQCGPPPGMPEMPGTPGGKDDPLRTNDKRWQNKRLKARKWIEEVRSVEGYVKSLADQAMIRGDSFKDRTAAIVAACALLPKPIVYQTYYEHYNVVVQHGFDEDRITAALVRSAERGSRVSKGLLHFLDIVLHRLMRQNGYRPSTIYDDLVPSVLRRIGNLWPDPDAFAGHVPSALIDGLLGKESVAKATVQNPDYEGKLAPIKMPSKGWFFAYCRWFKSLPDGGEALFVRRYGEKTWEEEHLVWDTFVRRAQYSRQIVFGDHYKMDFITVDKESRQVRLRLWLTLFIDAYSRAILGMALHYEDPCIESIQSGCRNMMLPKTYLKDMGIELSWIAYGIPMQLYLDNAWAHHSGSLESLAYSLSQVGGKNEYDLMEPVPKPPHMARYGAIIEALFGNLRQQIVEFLAKAGAIRSASSEDHRNAEKMARLLYEDVYYIMHVLIVNYMHKPHSGLGGMSPHNKWLEGIDKFPVRVPPMTPDLLRLFLRKAPYTRTKTAKGIRLFGLEYRAAWLEMAQSVDIYGNKIAYEIRYDPADISKLDLFVRDRYVGTVYAKKLMEADGTYRRVSLAERKWARSITSRLNSAPDYWVDLLKFSERLDATVKLRGEEKRRAHQIQLEQSEKVATEMLSKSEAGPSFAVAAGAEMIAPRDTARQASAAAQVTHLTVMPKSDSKSRNMRTGTTVTTAEASNSGRRGAPRLSVVPGDGDNGPGKRTKKGSQAKKGNQADRDANEASASWSDDAPILSDEERMQLSSSWSAQHEPDEYGYDEYEGY